MVRLGRRTPVVIVPLGIMKPAAGIKARVGGKKTGRVVVGEDEKDSRPLWGDGRGTVGRTVW